MDPEPSSPPEVVTLPGYARPHGSKVVRPASPLVGFASLSEDISASRSAVIGSAPPPSSLASEGFDLEVFLAHRWSAEVEDVHAPPLLGLDPLQSMTGMACRRPFRRRRLPWSFCPFSVFGGGNPLTRDLPRPGSGAAAEFLTLLPPCVSRVPPVLSDR